jgi:hypothetical protein
MFGKNEIYLGARCFLENAFGVATKNAEFILLMQFVP